MVGVREPALQTAEVAPADGRPVVGVAAHAERRVGQVASRPGAMAAAPRARRRRITTTTAIGTTTTTTPPAQTGPPLVPIAVLPPLPHATAGTDRPEAVGTERDRLPTGPAVAAVVVVPPALVTCRISTSADKSCCVRQGRGLGPPPPNEAHDQGGRCSRRRCQSAFATLPFPTLMGHALLLRRLFLAQARVGLCSLATHGRALAFSYFGLIASCEPQRLCGVVWCGVPRMYGLVGCVSCAAGSVGVSSRMVVWCVFFLFSRVTLAVLLGVVWSSSIIWRPSRTYAFPPATQFRLSSLATVAVHVCDPLKGKHRARVGEKKNTRSSSGAS